jgi:hypothetical protein
MSARLIAARATLRAATLAPEEEVARLIWYVKSGHNRILP